MVVIPREQRADLGGHGEGRALWLCAERGGGRSACGHDLPFPAGEQRPAALLEPRKGLQGFKFRHGLRRPARNSGALDETVPVALRRLRPQAERAALDEVGHDLGQRGRIVIGGVGGGRDLGAVVHEQALGRVVLRGKILHLRGKLLPQAGRFTAELPGAEDFAPPALRFAHEVRGGADARQQRIKALGGEWRLDLGPEFGAVLAGVAAAAGLLGEQRGQLGGAHQSVRRRQRLGKVGLVLGRECGAGLVELGEFSR